MGRPPLTPHPSGPRVVYGAEDEAGADDHVGQPRVLIVEDDFLVASEAEATLREAGFVVVGVVASAEEAVQVASFNHPLLVLMDIRLAGRRDGIDAAIELSREHGIRSVFTTAHSNAEIGQRAMEADPLGWLQKPYNRSSLVSLVRWAAAEIARKR